MLDYAGGAMACLSADLPSETAIETANMLPKLLQLLASGGPVAMWAAFLLSSLASSSPEHVASIISAGCIPAIVSLFTAGAEGAPFAAALAGIASHANSGQTAALVAAGAVPPLVDRPHIPVSMNVSISYDFVESSE